MPRKRVLFTAKELSPLPPFPIRYVTTGSSVASKQHQPLPTNLETTATTNPQLEKIHASKLHSFLSTHISVTILLYLLSRSAIFTTLPFTLLFSRYFSQSVACVRACVRVYNGSSGLVRVRSYVTA